MCIFCSLSAILDLFLRFHALSYSCTTLDFSSILIFLLYCIYLLVRLVVVALFEKSKREKDFLKVLSY